MSETVKQPDLPPEEQTKMEGELAPEKNTPVASGTETKTDDDALAKVEGTETKTDLPKEKDKEEAAQSVKSEMTGAMEGSAGRIHTAAPGRIHTAAPSIKEEPGILDDRAGDSQGKEVIGDAIKLEKEVAQKGTIPVLVKDLTSGNDVIPNEKVPEDGNVEASVLTNTSGTGTSSPKEQELQNKGESVELSGSTTETIDSASCGELTPAVSANMGTKTDVVLPSVIKEETPLEPEGTCKGFKETKKESILTTVAEASAVRGSDKMEIDSEVKPLTDIYKNTVQNKESSTQDNVQKINISNVGVQKKETHHADTLQKQDALSINSFMPQRESVTVDIMPKKEVLPQIAVDQNKAVHEIIAEQSSRLDRDRLVPTVGSLDRQSISQTSLSPIPSVGEKLVSTSLPSVVENVTTSVPSIVPTVVPAEKENLVPNPVPQEKSEPTAVSESRVPAAADSKTEVQESLDDWDVPATDDEEDDAENPAGDGVEKKKRKVVKRGYWEPPIDVIVDLYNKLDKDGILELTWKCPGRRPPSEEGDKEEEKELVEDVPDEEAMEISQEEDPTEFDFDMDVESVQKMTPRRNIGPGQAQGSGKKRVARMDKVLNDIFRHRKIDNSMVDSEKKDVEGQEGDQAMDTSTSPILLPTRPADKFHIRSDLTI